MLKSKFGNYVLIILGMLLLTSCVSMQEIALGDAYKACARGDYHAALRRLSNAENYGSRQSPYCDSIQMLRGTCFQRLEQKDSAKSVYEKLVATTSNATVSAAARQQLAILDMPGQKQVGKFNIPPLFPFHQIVEVRTDQRVWECGYAAANDNQAIIEYVQPGETVHNWTELVTLQFSQYAQPQSVQKIYEVYKDLLIKQSPQTTFTVLQETTNSILFEWKHPRDATWPAQHQLSKIIVTGNGQYTFSYVKKTQALDAATYTAWKDILTEAVVR